MDELECLLPGLKVSLALMRQRPVAPENDKAVGLASEDDEASPGVGGKRRHNEAWRGEVGEGESAGSPKKANLRRTADVMLASLRLSPSSSASSSVLEAIPALQQLQAGITIAMVEELDDSPKNSNPNSVFPSRDSTGEAALPLASALGHTCGAHNLSLNLPPAGSAAPGPFSLASCDEAQGAPGEEASPEMYRKTNTAPARLGQTLSKKGESEKAEGTLGAEPGTPLSSGGCNGAVEVPAVDELPLRGQLEREGSESPPPVRPRGSLSRAEKWHERISMATLRLRQNSLPRSQQLSIRIAAASAAP